MRVMQGQDHRAQHMKWYRETIGKVTLCHSFIERQLDSSQHFAALYYKPDM